DSFTRLPDYPITRFERSALWRHRRHVRGDGHHFLFGEVLHRGQHKLAPDARASALLDIEHLAHEIAWRPAGERRHRAESVKPRPVTDGAAFGLAVATSLDKRFSSLETPNWHIRREARARVAQHLGVLRVVWRLDDAPAERLSATALNLQEHPALHSRLRRRLAFDDLDPRRPLHRAEVFGGGMQLSIGHPLRDCDHDVRVRLAGMGALSRAASEVVHRLDEVLDR